MQIAVDVLKKNPTLTASFAGDGPLRVELEAMSQSAGLTDRVHFLGALSQDALAHAYRTSTLLVHTAGWEGWGMPMIEAMACGCVVVTNDTGCAGEAVRHNETGAVVRGDKESFVETIEQLLGNHERLRALQEAGIREANLWTESAQIRKIAEFYKHITHEHN